MLDTTYADAPARVVERRSACVGGSGPLLATVDLPRAASGYTVRAHVDVDEDGAVSAGDFVTTAAYPVRGEDPMRLVVKKV